MQSTSLGLYFVIYFWGVELCSLIFWFFRKAWVFECIKWTLARIHKPQILLIDSLMTLDTMETWLTNMWENSNLLSKCVSWQNMKINSSFLVSVAFMNQAKWMQLLRFPPIGSRHGLACAFNENQRLKIL